MISELLSISAQIIAMTQNMPAMPSPSAGASPPSHAVV